MRNYVEPAYDDTVCSCGGKLADTVQPFSWQDHGFHHVGCATACAEPFRLRGTTVSLELARMGSGRGPGLEESILRPLVKGLSEVPEGILALDKLRSEDDPHCPTTGSWAWRLYRTDQRGTFSECVAFRLTHRKEQ